MQSDTLELEHKATTQTFRSQLLRGSHRRMANGSDESSYPEDWIIFTTCIGVWFLVALALKFFCMKFFDGKTRCYSEHDFDVALSEAEAKTLRQQQEEKHQEQKHLEIPKAKFEFYDSDFLLTYTDENTKAMSTGFARLTMSNNGTGYSISGMFADTNSAEIHDGYVAYSGDAWWVTHSNEESGLRVLSIGSFNFGNNRFHGTWRDNRGNRGKYVRFESTRAFISTSKAPIATNPLTSEENIRRGSSMWNNTNQSLSVRGGDEEKPLP